MDVAEHAVEGLVDEKLCRGRAVTDGDDVEVVSESPRQHGPERVVVLDHQETRTFAVLRLSHESRVPSSHLQESFVNL